MYVVPSRRKKSGGGEHRSPYLFNANEPLYHLSYTPLTGGGESLDSYSTAVHGRDVFSSTHSNTFQGDVYRWHLCVSTCFSPGRGISAFA